MFVTLAGWERDFYDRKFVPNFVWADLKEER